MTVAFLTYYNSMHVNIKAKYFDNGEDKIYFFAMTPEVQNRKASVKPDYLSNIHPIVIKPDKDGWQTLLNALEIRKYISRYNIDIIHIIDMQYAVYAVLLKCMGVKVVMENNGSDVLKLPDEHPELSRKYRFCYRFCDAVVQDSKVAQKKGIELGASKKNNTVIDLGIDLGIFHPGIQKGKFKKEHAIKENAHIIFSPRSFTPLYNIEDIIDTIKPVLDKFPDTVYVFCSHVKDRRYVKRLEELDMKEHIILLGYVDNEKELPYVYADSDVVVSVPSSDSSPRTVYEAMACGCTVIVSDLPWIKGKLQEQRDIIVTPLNDSRRLTENILDVLEGNMILDRESMNRRVNRLFDYKISAKKLIKLYHLVLGGSRKR